MLCPCGVHPVASGSGRGRAASTAPRRSSMARSTSWSSEVESAALACPLVNHPTRPWFPSVLKFGVF
eukprot:4835100-Alexandrium_andersonii.AAC.1